METAETSSGLVRLYSICVVLMTSNEVHTVLYCLYVDAKTIGLELNVIGKSSVKPRDPYMLPFWLLILVVWLSVHQHSVNPSLHFRYLQFPLVPVEVTLFAIPRLDLVASAVVPPVPPLAMGRVPEVMSPAPWV